MFYLTAEITPMKPFNGSMRYVIPIVPVMCYFSIKCIWQISKLLPIKKTEMTFAVVTCCCLAFPIYDTANLLYYLNRDTRGQLRNWLHEVEGKSIKEKYATKRNVGRLYTHLKKNGIKSDAKYIITSSFCYSRYLYAGALPDQKPKVYHRHQFYKKLLKKTYKEFKPAYKTFALSNPTINVILVSDLIESGFFKKEGIKIKKSKKKKKKKKKGKRQKDPLIQN